MRIIKPEDCLHYGVCEFANDAGCFEGCDFRLEKMKSDNVLSNSNTNEIKIYDTNKRQVKENDKVRILYTDWINKEKDSRYGIVKWYADEARYLIEFNTKDYYGNSETGDFNFGLHGELEILG